MTTHKYWYKGKKSQVHLGANFIVMLTKIKNSFWGILPPRKLDYPNTMAWSQPSWGQPLWPLEDVRAEVLGNLPFFPSPTHLCHLRLFFFLPFICWWTFYLMSNFYRGYNIVQRSPVYPLPRFTNCLCFIPFSLSFHLSYIFLNIWVTYIMLLYSLICQYIFLKTKTLFYITTVQ